ncbi:MAG TPA: hypothetical protein PLA90_09425 [Candidatus Sumerlaeota bacterium]|nr:hypothetical protein [Candidatus Sumerlaeota bacterium]HPS01751.1 hypothetical protein [Candidatus Sumerlaeota bacterium]
MEMFDLIIQNPITHQMIQWSLLILAFLALRYFFNDTVNLEGMSGFFLGLFILIPGNVLLHHHLLPMSSMPGLAQMGSIFLLNLILLLLLTRFAPGLTVSSYGSLAFFAILLSIATFSMRFVPECPDLVAMVSQGL